MIGATVAGVAVPAMVELSSRSGVDVTGTL